MKKGVFLFLFSVFSPIVFGQNGQIFPDRLQVPYLNQAQIIALTEVSQGQVVFNTSTKHLELFNGTEWVRIAELKEAMSKVFKVAETTAGNNEWRAARDHLGNTIIVGFFTTNVIVGNTTINTFNNKLLLIKLDTSGNVIWFKTTGSWDEKRLGDIEVDASGNFYVCGNFRSDLILDAITLSTTSSDFDVFLAKFDANGNALWAVSGTNSNAYASADELALDPSGSPLLGGKFMGSLTFGANTLYASESAYLVKYSNSGTLEYTFSFGHSGVFINDIDFHSNGKALISGVFGGNIWLGSNNLVSNGSNDIFLWQISTTGTTDWALSFGGFNIDGHPRSCYDADGNAYLTGNFIGTVSHFGSVLSSIFPNFYSIFLAKYNSNGALQKIKSIGTSPSYISLANVVFLNNELYVCGNSTNSFLLQNVDLQSFTFKQFIAKYDSNTFANKGIQVDLGGNSSTRDFKLGLDSKFFSFGNSVNGVSVPSGLAVDFPTFSRGYFYYLP